MLFRSTHTAYRSRKRTPTRKRTHTAYRSRKRGAHRGTRHGRGWYEIRLDFVTDALRGRLAPPAVAADLPQDRPQPGLAFQPRLLPAMETGDRAPRTAGLARMLGRGLQPATPANEDTVELQQLARCRPGLPNRSTAGRAGQGYGPGAVSGPPAATSAAPLPCKAAVDSLARTWGRPWPLHDEMMQPRSWRPRILDGTPDRCW